MRTGACPTGVRYVERHTSQTVSLSVIFLLLSAVPCSRRLSQRSCQRHGRHKHHVIAPSRPALGVAVGMPVDEVDAGLPAAVARRDTAEATQWPLPRRQTWFRLQQTVAGECLRHNCAGKDQAWRWPGVEILRPSPPANNGALRRRTCTPPACCDSTWARWTK